jgi:hypothetical protein
MITAVFMSKTVAVFSDAKKHTAQPCFLNYLASENKAVILQRASWWRLP